jgi:hypothetical protein
VGIVLAVLGVGAGAALGQRPETRAEAEDKTKESGIRETQVSLEIESERQRNRFRATVLSKDGDRLTVLTAAHCLSAKDLGKTVHVSHGGNSFTGRVGAVVQNPSYRHAQYGDSPGADNAIAVVENIAWEDADAAWFRGLKTAEVAAWPVSDLGGRPVPARIEDQFGKEHVVRAGNFSNPKWLEWGPSYRPLPGDSGSGVFIFPRNGDGKPRPTLIGVVVDRSDLGGGASVVSRRYRWLDEAAPARSTSRMKPQATK